MSEEEEELEEMIADEISRFIKAFKDYKGKKPMCATKKFEKYTLKVTKSPLPGKNKLEEAIRKAIETKKDVFVEFLEGNAIYQVVKRR
jgi:hypothetical protein